MLRTDVVQEMSQLIKLQRRSRYKSPLSSFRRSRWLDAAVAVDAERLSTKTLDLISLAACSCVLTLLCHSAANLPQSTATVSSATARNAAPLSKNGRTLFQPYTLIASSPELKEDEDEGIA